MHGLNLLAVRPLTESDRVAAQKFLDEAHGGRINADVFYEKGCISLVVEDAQGEVMFVRLTPAFRVDIQFLPEHSRRTPLAVRSLFKYATEKFGAKEYIFETRVPMLARFMKIFGFNHEPDSYVFRVEK